MPDPADVNSMFARVARRYDRANRWLSLGIDVWWRRRLVAAVRERRPRDVLDLATGSGDVAFALADGLPPAVPVTGLDFCAPMLVEAEKKKAAGGLRYQTVTFGPGDILALPLPDGSFDAVTLSFGLRNVADRHRALLEIRRVLRPGGRLFVLEFSQPAAWLRPLYYLYLGKVTPRLAGLITGEPAAYEYLGRSIAEFPDRAGLAAEIAAAGFADVHARALTGGIVALHEAEAGGAAGLSRGSPDRRRAPG